MIELYDKYINYDGINYKLKNEDAILSELHIYISRESSYKQYKKRFKNYIMKYIRDQSILIAIPESITIQNILAFFSVYVFNDKFTSKYFLTILMVKH